MMRRISQTLWVLLCTLGLLAGCQSTFQERSEARQGASVMKYLFPNDDTSASMALADTAQLRIPLRVGVAFVPSRGLASVGASPAQQQQMLDQVVRAFQSYPFIGEIKPIPSSYLAEGGGFADLGRAAGMFGVDVVALLSYDQVQFTEKTNKSLWYWTLVGAYIVRGDQHDVHTMIEATVVDVKSRQLLFRASGTDLQSGSSTASSLAETTRAARGTGFRKAMDQLIPALQVSLEEFRARARSGTAPGVNLQLPPGYDPAASAPAR